MDYFIVELSQQQKIAIPLNEVKEVMSINYTDICPIPGVKNSLLGIISQKGSLLWLLDLSQLLHDFQLLTNKFHSLTILVTKIEENYIKTGKVKIVIYVLPPLELARAGFCANQAGKFLEFNDYIFNHQADITREDALLSAAKNMGLGDGFEQCYNSDLAKTAAQDWYNKANEIKIEGTPTFYINGQQIVGAQPYEEFQKIIDSKL